jgi:hypothetical protein
VCLILPACTVLHNAVMMFIHLNRSMASESQGGNKTKKPQQPTCERVFASPTSANGPLDRGDRPDQLRLSQLQAMNALFGPLPPAATIALPVERYGESTPRLLENWCPLPLHWNHQDGV